MKKKQKLRIKQNTQTASSKPFKRDWIKQKEN